MHGAQQVSLIRQQGREEVARALLTPAEAGDRGWDTESGDPEPKISLNTLGAGTQHGQILGLYICLSTEGGMHSPSSSTGVQNCNSALMYTY